MRNVTRRTALNFLEGVTGKLSNTEVTRYDDHHAGRCYDLRLHGNVIANRSEADGIYLTLSGYNTLTTRERLNGILELINRPYRFAQRKGEAVLIWSERGKEQKLRLDDDCNYCLDYFDRKTGFNA